MRRPSDKEARAALSRVSRLPRLLRVPHRRLLKRQGSHTANLRPNGPPSRNVHRRLLQPHRPRRLPQCLRSLLLPKFPISALATMVPLARSRGPRLRMRTCTARRNSSRHTANPSSASTTQPTMPISVSIQVRRLSRPGRSSNTWSSNHTCSSSQRTSLNINLSTSSLRTSHNTSLSNNRSCSSRRCSR